MLDLMHVPPTQQSDALGARSDPNVEARATGKVILCLGIKHAQKQKRKVKQMVTMKM